ncbi:MAG TPA: hypothetical protein VFQ35_12965 [Polyangiaceae bacterium]|nr:hypothetical protein [Polyangiaceae bacterium]
MADLVTRGLERRRERRDTEALALFRDAYSISATPMILAQIALAEQALGQWLLAEQDLTAALATHDGWVEANRDALDRALVVIQSHLSWLAVTTNVESAEVWLDDRKLGVVRAAPWRVIQGPHELSLRLADGRSSTRSLELSAGAREHFHVDFSPLLPSIASGPHARAPRVRQSAKTFDAANATPETNTRKTLAFASAALSVSAFAGAVTASLLRLEYAHHYNSDACAPDRSQKCAAYRDVAERLGTVAVVGYAVAGVGALGSVALFTAPYWLPGPDPKASQAGLCVWGTF